MPVSVIIPVLNEEKTILSLLQDLQSCRQEGHELIVVDGGSKDQTMLIARELSDKVISASKGRAMQMNAGAAQAKNEILWFLHSDTKISGEEIKIIQSSLKDKVWGRFNIKLSGTNVLFRVIETMINIRSYISGIATGDQGIFVKRDIFESVNGYTDIPLMEDIDLSKKLKNIKRPVCLSSVLITSSRRWENKGIIVTVLLMWRLRFLYWLGVSPVILAEHYR